METVHTPHPHSRLWLSITITVILIAAIISAYYLSNARKIKTSADSRLTQTQMVASETATATPSATPSPETTPATAVSEAKQAVSEVDTKEVKDAITQLQATLKIFQK